MIWISVYYINVCSSAICFTRGAANICNSIFAVDLKLIHLGAVNHGNFKTEFFHKFHWLIKSLGNSLSHPKLLLQIFWIKSFTFTMIGQINPIGLNIELTILSALSGKNKSGKNLVTSEKFVTFPRTIFKVKRNFMSVTAFFSRKKLFC